MALFYVILFLAIITVIIAVISIIKIFIDDFKYLSKIESEFFEKGMQMKEIKIIERIARLKENNKEYKKKYGRFRSSYKIIGEKRGLEKALKSLE